MESFLNILAKELLKRHPESLRNICVVLPTRRACGVFKSALVKEAASPIFSPQILTISEFISEPSDKIVAQKPVLLLHLYKAYIKYFPGTPFAKFYHWGQILLNDFDEIDRNLVKPDSIFSNLSDLKKLDFLFTDDEEQNNAVDQFIALFGKQKNSLLQETFLAIWDKLIDIYRQFNTELALQGLCYEGSMYKAYYERLISGAIVSKYEKTYFGGFYALSKAEDLIFQKMVSTGAAVCFWDIDEYYADAKTNQEAGKYLRKNKLLGTSYQWKFDYFKKNNRKIKITGVSQRSGQASYIGEILAEWNNTALTNANDSVIVLADEALLFPVLNHLPKEIQKVNISMGYPFKASMLYDWFNVINSIVRNSQESYLPASLLKAFVEHPLTINCVNKSNPAARSEFIRSLKNNLDKPVTDLEKCVSIALYQIISAKVTDAKQVFDFYSKLAEFSESLSGSTNEQAVAQTFRESLDELISSTKDDVIHLSIEDAFLLIKENMQTLSVPFDSGDGSGLQIMGFLETRLLDFRNVIITPVNEDSMPAASRFQTFIPFTLRRAFGLSTFQDKDAVYAYHFYRLLQRAENTELIYNSKTGSTGGGDKSRYLLQIKHEMKKRLGNKLMLEENTISAALHPIDRPAITINKSKEVLKRIEEIFGETGKFKPFSSSSLLTYIRCKLQFYFHYVAGIREPDSDDETMDAPAFGNVVHASLHKLYSTEKTIDASAISRLHAIVGNAVGECIEAEYSYPIAKIRGKNLLTIRAIEAFVGKVLQIDAANTPYELLGLEEKIETILPSQHRKVLITGTIDRVDIHRGLMRISDYKTGNIELLAKAISVEKLRESATSKPVYFQLLFYALLKHLSSGDSNFNLGTYMLKEIPPQYNTVYEIRNGSDTILDDYQELLKSLVEEIFSEAVPFTQTENQKTCEYCSFKGICGR